MTSCQPFFQTVVEEAGQLLESLDGVTAVHAQFYDLSSSFHKVCCNVRTYVFMHSFSCLYGAWQ